ncbi:MAG: type II toxin-antitoxin system VapC family toxin [Candidatus Nitrosocaldus sp.]
MDRGGGDKEMEEEKALVIDASVVVKWFNIEPLHDKAIAIRDRYIDGAIDLIAPTLIYYEVANALRYNPRFGIEEVRAAVKALEDLSLTTYEFSMDMASKAVEIAYMYGITVYDAAYVSLAALMDTTLYTADKEVVAKVSATYVKHLSEFE